MARLLGRAVSHANRDNRSSALFSAPMPLAFVYLSSLTTVWNNWSSRFVKGQHRLRKMPIVPVLDLKMNNGICESFRRLSPGGVAHVFWSVCVHADDRFHADENIPALCGRTPWQLQRQAIHLYGPVPSNSLCTIVVVPRKFTGHRSLSASTKQEALSYGHPRQGCTKHLFFRHPSQGKSQMPQALFPYGRQVYRDRVRSDHSADRFQVGRRLSRQAATCEILRRRDRQTSGVPQQQFSSAPSPLLGSTKSDGKWNCSSSGSSRICVSSTFTGLCRMPDPDLDHRFCLSDRRHHQKTAESPGKSLYMRHYQHSDACRCV